MGMPEWQQLIELSERHGFVIAADECYSEIYNAEPPVGALQALHALGLPLDRVLSFNSLSKRSSAPGLRSGFVAGDPKLIAPFLHFRTYHGAAPSLLTQNASVAAWSDEAHVEENRKKYRHKFSAARSILGDVRIPEGGFFLWLPIEDDEGFARRALAEQALTVLPGSYLAREVDGFSPGAGHVRIALVPELDVCEEALTRLRELF